MLLKGKVCLITGGAAGIGKATAHECATEGAQVVIVDINSERLASTQEAFAAQSLSVVTLQADLTVKAEVEKACASVIEQFGRIDVIVNSHGVTHRLDTTASETPEEIFDLTIATNLKSIYLLCGAALPHMRKYGGSIVNIASIGSLVGFGGVAYTASKGGVAALTRHIAYQEAANNIRCNTVMPGLVDTEMVPIFRSKVGMVAGPTLPGAIQRMAKPEEIAHLAVFLASDRAAFITAASYVIDGGITQH